LNHRPHDSPVLYRATTVLGFNRRRVTMAPSGVLYRTVRTLHVVSHKHGTHNLTGNTPKHVISWWKISSTRVLVAGDFPTCDVMTRSSPHVTSLPEISLACEIIPRDVPHMGYHAIRFPSHAISIACNLMIRDLPHT